MTEKDLKNIIDKMTLEEKLLQLTQYNYWDIVDDDGKEKIVTGNTPCNGLKFDDCIKIGSILNTPDKEGIDLVRSIRKKHGINEPIIVMHDVIHGYRIQAPVPLAMACSFNPTLVERCAEASAIRAKENGIDATFSPMVDLVRDARWGRVMESNGEDPYLNGELGKAYIRGYHKGGVACCVKHFLGYGAAEGGRDYNTTEISDHTLNEYYLVGYRECMKEHPDMVMSSFNLLNGVPVLGNKKFTLDTLREKWGFDGVFISDFGAVEEMIKHGYCEDLKECAIVAIKSKLDIEMCSPAYFKCIPELIEEGLVTTEEVDECVMRVLKLKYRCGLYGDNDNNNDNGNNGGEIKARSLSISDERTLVRTMAEESCVLLKNDGVLPLKKTTNVLLCGPFADEKCIYGNWSCHAKGEDTVTVKEGVENLLGTPVRFIESKSSENADNDGGLCDGDLKLSKDDLKLLKEVDAIVCCVGESMFMSGETCSKTDISLGKEQIQLIKELKTFKKPLVLVVFGGRPLVLTEAEKYADAILYAWQPGTEGGNAIANLLYGMALPCGKTVMSFPRTVGQCPIYYNKFSTGRPPIDDKKISPAYSSGYLDCPNAPLYPFGYGLSYTTFEYADFSIDKPELCIDGKIIASVKVKNVGSFDGYETVQWYIHDRYGSCARPVKELKGFEKVFLKAGEEKVVRFEVTNKTLAYYTASGEYKAEEGKFDLFVGGNSEDCIQLEFTYSL